MARLTGSLEADDLGSPRTLEVPRERIYMIDACVLVMMHTLNRAPASGQETIRSRLTILNGRPAAGYIHAIDVFITKKCGK